MSEWISAKERLPETESPVLSFGYWGGGPQTAIGVYSPKFNTWYVIADIGTVALCVHHPLDATSEPAWRGGRVTMIRMIRLHIAEDVVDFINEHRIRKEDIVIIFSGSSGCVLIWEEVDSDASDN